MLVAMTQNNQTVVEAAGCFAEAKFALFSPGVGESLWVWS